jgi:hypothetical protein
MCLLKDKKHYITIDVIKNNSNNVLKIKHSIILDVLSEGPKF